MLSSENPSSVLTIQSTGMCWIVLILTSQNTQMALRPMKTLKLWFSRSRWPKDPALGLWSFSQPSSSIYQNSIQIGDKNIHHLAQTVFVAIMHYVKFLIDFINSSTSLMHQWYKKSCTCFIGVSINIVLCYKDPFDFCGKTCLQRICYFHKVNFANLMFYGVTPVSCVFLPLSNCHARHPSHVFWPTLCFFWMLHTFLWRLTNLITWTFLKTLSYFSTKFDYFISIMYILPSWSILPLSLICGSYMLILILTPTNPPFIHAL